MKLLSMFSIMNGLILLTSSALLLLFHHEGIALKISIYSYGFLLVGSMMQFVHFLKKR